MNSKSVTSCHAFLKAPFPTLDHLGYMLLFQGSLDLFAMEKCGNKDHK